MNANAASGEVQEDTCVAVRLELQDPPSLYRAPLPFVPVITPAKSLHRATSIESTDEGEGTPLAGVHTRGRTSWSKGGASMYSKYSLLRGVSTDRSNQYGTSPSSMTLFRRRSDGGTFVNNSEGGGRGFGNWMRRSLDDDGPTKDQPQNRTELAAVNKREEFTSYASCNGSSNSEVKGISKESDGKKSPNEEGDTKVLVETDLGGSHGNSSSQDKCESYRDYRTQNSWTMPSDVDFSWNKCARSINEMISCFETPVQKKSNVNTSNNTPRSVRISKTSRVPVMAMVERLTGSSNGSSK